MSVFSSEFWRSLYFLGMGGQAAGAESPDGTIRARLTGSGSLIATLAGAEGTVSVQTRRGKDDTRRKPFVPQYVEWTKERIEAVEKHNRELFSALIDPEEAPPLPQAEAGKIDAAQELERINLLILAAMQAAQDDARRRDRERLRKEAKRNKVAVPDTAEQTRALVVWLAKRAEALQQAEEDDEEAILLLAA